MLMKFEVRIETDEATKEELLEAIRERLSVLYPSGDTFYPASLVVFAL